MTKKIQRLHPRQLTVKQKQRKEIKKEIPSEKRRQIINEIRLIYTKRLIYAKIMKYQKIIRLLDNTATQPSMFRQKLTWNK